MTVVTSPQGRRRIVVHETKVIWSFTNYQFFEHFGLLHKTTKCGEWSLFSCAVTNSSNFVKTIEIGKIGILYIFLVKALNQKGRETSNYYFTKPPPVWVIVKKYKQN